jgi:hypothetical protein
MRGSWNGPRGPDPDELEGERCTIMSGIISFLAGGGPGSAPWMWAYLDPGSGSMLFQIIIAGLLSGVFCARSSFLKLKDSMFRINGRV